MTEPTIDGAAEAAPEAELGLSPLAELRAGFAEQAAEGRLYKRLPSARAKHRLVAEYRVLSMPEASTIINGDGTLEDALVPLAGALVQLHLHSPDDPRADKRQLVPLHIALDAEQLGPLSLDKRLTDLLGLKSGPASEILLELFDRHEVAVGAQAGELALWSHDTTEEAFQDFTEGS